MDMKRYIISDAANLVNVESHVLRYWEEELELNVPRNELGHRYYTEENIAQFMKIKELKEQGYQLKAIKILVHNQDGEREQVQMQEMDRPGGQEPNMTAQNMTTQNMASPNMTTQNMTVTVPNMTQQNMTTQNLTAQNMASPNMTTQNMTPPNMTSQQNRLGQNMQSTQNMQPGSQIGSENQIQPVIQAQTTQQQMAQNNAHNVERFQMLMSSIVKNAIQENNASLGREVTTQVGERVLKEMNYLMRMQDEQEEERYRKLDEAIRTRQKKRHFRKEKIKKADVKKTNKRFRKENVLDPKPNM